MQPFARLTHLISRAYYFRLAFMTWTPRQRGVLRL